MIHHHQKPKKTKEKITEYINSTSFLQWPSSRVQLEQCITDGGGRLRAQVGQQEGNVAWRRVVDERVSCAISSTTSLTTPTRLAISPLELLGNVRLVERKETRELVAFGEDVERLVVRLGADGQLVGADLASKES